MTREEQIKQAAQAYYPSGSLHEERTVSAFVRGAKWADDNQPCMAKIQKDNELFFLLKKRELIKKACEWLGNRDIMEKILHCRTSLIDDYVKEFRKAMEE